MSNNKANEKQLNVPISSLYNFLGDSEYAQSENHTLGVTYGNANDETGEVSAELVKNSLYLGYSLTDFIKNHRLKKAEITLYQQAIVVNEDKYCKLGVFRYDDGIYEDCSIAGVSELCDYVKIRTPEEDEIISYTFDITEIIEKVAKENNGTLGLVIKPISEDLQQESYITIYGEGESEYAPKFTITYEANHGVNTSYRALSHDLGFFGQGSIDLQYGNLMFDSTDFSWGGGRMPVTIKHLYNSALYNQQYTQKSSIGLNTADFSAMKLGYGFKLNAMQSIIKDSDGDYIYTDENGEQIYLLATDDADKFVSSEEDGELEYCESKRTLKSGDEYRFDEAGRLVSITDQNGNTNIITYQDGKLIAVADGVGRKFIFGYNDKNYLTSITAPDNTQVAFAYTGNYLSSVTHEDGKKAEITYTNNKPTAIVLYENDIAVCKTEYTHGDHNNVTEMIEYGAENGEFVKGNTTSFDYSVASHRTKVCKNSTETTVCVFDEDGNVISEYLDRDYNRVGASANGGSENVNYQISIVNQLLDHNFESLDNWQTAENNLSSTEITICEDEMTAQYGKHCLSIKTNEDGAVRNGVFQETLPGGDDESTFSAYVKIASGFEGENDGVYLRISNQELGVLAQSEKIKQKFDEFIRISIGEWLSSSSTLKVEILADGKGEAYIDAVQLERNASANAYNILEDSGFYKQKSWALQNAELINESDNAFNYSGSLKIEGKLDEECNASQTVEVKSTDTTRETFRLSGWANGYGLPVGDNKGETPPTFRLRAVISYTDGTSCEHTADFNTSVEEWQYASVEFSKDAFKAVENLQVFCDYDYNYGTAYFDNIELVRTSIETGLSAEDFAEEAEDTQEAETFDLKKNDDEQPEETADFQELLDAFGNALTETTFQDGEYGTIYRSFGYDEDGNNLLTEIDARGNKTEYAVDGVTSRTEEITDRMGNKTAYEYDKSGRTTKVTSKDTNNTELSHVSYKYDALDNLTEIKRGDGLKYVLKYNAFRDLESIGIDGKQDGNLITYSYNTGSGRLKEMSYANGDRMTATYNGLGQMIAEKWYNKYDNKIAHYKYAYDSNGNIVRSIDIKDRKMYNYMYEDGRLTYACESDVVFSEYNYVTRKTPLYVVRYFYDNEGNLATKRTVFADGKEQVVTYETAENETQLVKTVIGEHSFVSVAKTDSFGRKEFDEIQLSKCSVARKFDYLKGQATEEHIENGKYKSVPTTQLVSKITFSDGRTIQYEYDAEERITKVIDSLDGVTEYTYDSLGQLLTETKNGEVINQITYDNYGNILSKNGIGYVYNDKWKDRLDFYDGKAITYDEQGNPESYRDHWLIWEKGRQLKFFDSIRYTYNANGIRNSKTIDNVRHEFCLDGAKILRETWNGNTLEPIYDQEDSVCGIIYNQTPYYFVKNLQGDVISITDSQGKEVARYSYDAWGKCEIDKDFQSSLIAHINPFRYRSYYYDIETGLYYLQSRYYDAEVGRFLNSDMVEIATIPEQILQTNLFAYCGNEPINYIDLTGYVVTPANVIGAVIGLVLGAVGGYFLSRFLADKIGLKGWKRTTFIVGISAIISAAAAVIGYFIGPYIAKAFKALLKGLRGLFKPKFGTQLGRLGTLTRNTKPVIKGLTKHGLQRMTQRGVSKKLAQKIINTGYAIAQSGGKILYFTKEGVVVLTSAGQVVTAYSSKYFDDAMQAIVSLFYK